MEGGEGRGAGGVGKKGRETGGEGGTGGEGVCRETGGERCFAEEWEGLRGARRKCRAEGKVKNQATEVILKTKAKRRDESILEMAHLLVLTESPVMSPFPFFSKVVFGKGKLFGTNNRGP